VLESALAEVGRCFLPLCSSTACFYFADDNELEGVRIDPAEPGRDQYPHKFS